MEKTRITYVSPTEHRSSVNHFGRFLGYLVKMHPGVTTRSPKNRQRRTGRGHVILKVDADKVVKRLSEKGFCHKDGTPTPNFTFLSDTQAVTNEKINRIFRGILNYYKIADNRVNFGCRLFYIFSLSLAKVYAAKFR